MLWNFMQLYYWLCDYLPEWIYFNISSAKLMVVTLHLATCVFTTFRLYLILVIRCCEYWTFSDEQTVCLQQADKTTVKTDVDLRSLPVVRAPSKSGTDSSDSDAEVLATLDKRRKQRNKILEGRNFLMILCSTWR